MASNTLSKAQVIYGEPLCHVTLTAAETIDITGGFFVNLKSGAGTADHTIANDSVISGWLDIGVSPDDSNVTDNVLTVPSSPGERYTFPFYSAALDLVVRMPVSSGLTVAASYGGTLVDILIATSKQTVAIDTSSTNVLQILPPNAEDIASNTVRIVVNPAKVGR